MARTAIPAVDEMEFYELVAALTDDCAATSRRIAERFHEEIPSYTRLRSSDITPAGAAVRRRP